MNWFAQVLTLLRRILAELQHVRKLIQVPQALTIQFKGEQPGMPATMTDVQTVAVSGVVATDAAGEPVTLDTTKLVTSVGDPTLLTFTLDPTTNLPTFAFNKGGFTGSLPATSQVSLQDPVNGLTAQDTITVNTSAATAETIQFAPPTP